MPRWRRFLKWFFQAAFFMIGTIVVLNYGLMFLFRWRVWCATHYTGLQAFMVYMGPFIIGISGFIAWMRSESKYGH